MNIPIIQYKTFKFTYTRYTKAFHTKMNREVIAKLLAILLLVVFGHLFRTFKCNFIIYHVYGSTVRHLMMR